MLLLVGAATHYVAVPTIRPCRLGFLPRPPENMTPASIIVTEHIFA